MEAEEYVYRVRITQREAYADRDEYGHMEPHFTTEARAYYDEVNKGIVPTDKDKKKDKDEDPARKRARKQAREEQDAARKLACAHRNVERVYITREAAMDCVARAKWRFLCDYLGGFYDAADFASFSKCQYHPTPALDMGKYWAPNGKATTYTKAPLDMDAIRADLRLLFATFNSLEYTPEPLDISVRQERRTA